MLARCVPPALSHTPTPLLLIGSLLFTLWILHATQPPDGIETVYKLPSHSPIIGKECAICMEEFEEEVAIARLPCLCFFHRECIDSWLQRGKACPVHAREW